MDEFASSRYAGLARGPIAASLVETHFPSFPVVETIICRMITLSVLSIRAPSIIRVNARSSHCLLRVPARSNAHSKQYDIIMVYTYVSGRRTFNAHRAYTRCVFVFVAVQNEYSMFWIVFDLTSICTIHKYSTINNIYSSCYIRVYRVQMSNDFPSKHCAFCQ